VSPVINSISLPAAGVYTTGNDLEFIISIPRKFSLPQMIIRLFFPLASEINKKCGVYHGSGSSVLVFRYKVQAEWYRYWRYRTDRILNDSYFSIKDSVGNNASVLLNRNGIIAGTQVNPPSFYKRTDHSGKQHLQNRGHTYLFARYNEDVFVTTTNGNPSMKITIGSTSKQAVYTK